MYKQAKPFFLHVLTPLHAGSGNDLGIVDLPIQRERHTQFPKIEGSSLKGSIREVFEEKYQSKDDRVDLHWAFGYDESNEKDNGVKKFFEDSKHTEFSGALGFTDARILFFPVKSMKGVFAWITCAKVLQHFTSDLALCKPEIGNDKLNYSPQESDKAQRTKDSLVTFSEKVILEEYTFDTEENTALTDFAAEIGKFLGITDLQKKAILLPDNDFNDFVQLSTEVITRTKINNETGTVAKGQLFTEEYLPAETILYSLALASPIFTKVEIKTGRFKSSAKEPQVMAFFEEGLPPVMQIGANATLGKGITAAKVYTTVEEKKGTRGKEKEVSGKMQEVKNEQG
ncbi:MAG: type III-B CRISPR module RAMP protein Cmr4 [Candidatus Brocadia sp. WS118]|nr:MAG: type III-B CRISPR module RAMP protein Cmr4 [Candidatus Brocadia sp. WS118]